MTVHSDPTRPVPDAPRVPLPTLLGDLAQADLPALRQHWQGRWGGRRQPCARLTFYA